VRRWWRRSRNRSRTSPVARPGETRWALPGATPRSCSARLAEFSSCEVANGLGWFVPDEQIEDQDEDVVMTTVERSPRVEVVVPAEYRPPAAVMVDLAEVITEHTRLVKACS